MQKVIILGMTDENGELTHKELIFDTKVEINMHNIENYIISDSYDLCAGVNFSECGALIIAHTLLDYVDLVDINKFYDFIISEFKECGSQLLSDEFISEDELIERYNFESEMFY